MPTYDYRCHGCGKIREEIHSMKESPDFSCSECSCSDPMERLISRNDAGLFFIQGFTPGKAMKESVRQRKKNAEMSLRQIERYGSGNNLIPNVGGKEFGSWSEAAKAAKSEGKKDSTYERVIQSEKVTSKVSGVNDSAWKKAKEDKFNA